MKTKRLLSVLLLLTVILLPLHALCDGLLYQVSTLQALMQGDYYGAVTLDEMVRHGDTGLGTFDALDGEMIVLDGAVYKAAYDGGIEAMGEDTLTPFANVAFIGDEEGAACVFDGGLDGLKAALSEYVPEENMPVVFRISGSFTGVTVRSVPRQAEPYPPLTEVVKNQAVFETDQTDGVIVGFRFPAYMGDINTVGYHLHFLSDDRTFGGHLLEAASGVIEIRYRELDAFSMVLPQSIKLYNTTQTTDADIEAVESR